MSGFYLAGTQLIGGEGCVVLLGRGGLLLLRLLARGARGGLLVLAPRLQTRPRNSDHVDLDV